MPQSSPVKSPGDALQDPDQKAIEGEAKEAATNEEDSNKLLNLPSAKTRSVAPRDFNRRLNAIETDIDGLNSEFSESRASFLALVAEFRSGAILTSTELAQARKRLQSQHRVQGSLLGATTKIDRRLSKLDQKILDREETLDQVQSQARAQTSLLAASTKMDRRISRLNDQMKAVDQSMATQQSRLDELHGLRIELKQLRDGISRADVRAREKLDAAFGKLERQIHRNKAQLETLSALGSDATLELSRIDLRHTELSDSLTKLSTSVAIQAELGHTRFKGQVISLVLLALAVLIYGLYAQFSPSALPASMETQVAGLDSRLSQLEVLGGSVAAINRRLGNLESSLATNKQFTSDTTEAVTRNLDEIARVRSEVEELSLAIGQMQEGSGSAAVVGENSEKGHGISVQGTNWLNSRPAERYTIQILGQYPVRLLNAVLDQNNKVLASAPLAVTEYEWQGKTLVNVFFGDFANYSEAQLALKNLPRRLRVNRPWIRDFGHIQG